jgi:hypothetical protein
MNIPDARNDQEMISEVLTYTDGQVQFDFDLEWVDDQLVVLIICGEQPTSGDYPEGAPQTIHATTDAIAARLWVLEHFDHPMTRGDALALAGDHAQDFGTILGAGWNGPTGAAWVRGMDRKARTA